MRRFVAGVPGAMTAGERRTERRQRHEDYFCIIKLSLINK